MNINEQESIFCQAIATTSLLGELYNTDFLKSDYFNKTISFGENNDAIKKILIMSGLGNPATLQMFLYILLVMPKETLSTLDDTIVNSRADSLKTAIIQFSPAVSTTYPGESDNDLLTIDYYRHIRNAVSHAKCVYTTENNRTYVTFKDEDPRNSAHRCEIKMYTSDAGKMLEVLQGQILTYLKDQWDNR